MHNGKKKVSFGKRANKYDGGFEGRFLNKFYNVLLNFVKVSPEVKVLDVACGTGESLKRMDEKYGIDGFGIDVDDKMVNVAKEKCPQMDIRTAACDAMPFDNQQFGVMTVCMAYHHFENKRGFAQEASRVLAEGGSLYVVDLRLPKYLRKVVNGLMKHLNIVGQFFTPEEITNGFSEFGFKYNGCVTEGRVQVVWLTKIH
jgi:ubiquinone/menaquinone biosynthesis C-methylase UbiE